MKGIAGFLDLLVAAVLAGLAVVVTFAPLAIGVPVRAVLALPLVLVLPGYAAVAALLPRFERWSADGLAYSVGLSLSLTAIVCLALNFTPGGLERRSIAISLAAVTIVAAAAACFRRSWTTARAERGGRMRATPGQLVVFALALLTAAAAVGVARLGAVRADGRTTFTQLWMLPDKGTAAGRTGTSVRIGIRNEEGSNETYRLLVRARGRRVASWSAITIAPGKHWAHILQVPGNLPARTPLEAELFRAERPARVYRQVTFWVPSNESRH